MLILVSQLTGRPVITLDEAEPLGIIQDPIIDPNNGKVVGYFIGAGFLHLRRSVVAAVDVASYDENRIVLHSASAVSEAENEPKIREILKKKIPVLGASVITESGKNLGRANDLLADTELSMIVKYYAHGMMADRIIPAERVISIEKRGIIVDDNATVTASVPAEAA